MSSWRIAAWFIAGVAALVACSAEVRPSPAGPLTPVTISDGGFCQADETAVARSDGLAGPVDLAPDGSGSLEGRGTVANVPEGTYVVDVECASGRSSRAEFDVAAMPKPPDTGFVPDGVKTRLGRAQLMSPPGPSLDALTGPIDASADATPLPRSQPVRLAIPALGVDAPLATVGRTGSGSIGAPGANNATSAAWYDVGFSPGELGSAIIVGHVNTLEGPGVFYRASTLQPGDTIDVERADGVVATFTVDAVREYPKQAFPAAEIFDPRGRAGLVLITCGGEFDPGSGYASNIVVYAHMTATSS